MLKNISNLGKALNKAEQKEVNGGRRKRFICNFGPNPTICNFRHQCTQDPGGTWYCSN